MPDPIQRFGVYGHPPADIVPVPASPMRFSPLEPGAHDLGAQDPESLDAMVVAAPPGTIERRYILALALRALKVGAPLSALALKDKGGLRVKSELATFGCTVAETARRHVRLCETERPTELAGIDAAIEAGALYFDEKLGAFTQAGIFSFDRVDPGSALLMAQLPVLFGHGADLGCGTGTLSQVVLRSPRVEKLTLVDIDRRAVEAARRNIADARAEIHWADARTEPTSLAGLDFVVMNPPFHDAGIEDRALGQAFIRRAALILKRGGTLWMTANRHLPYEGILAPLFRHVAVLAEDGGYKIFEAKK